MNKPKSDEQPAAPQSLPAPKVESSPKAVGLPRRFRDTVFTSRTLIPPNGESLVRAYLSSPVEFSRISSGFSMRLHPILNSWRQHNGTDFAAPTGTAVRSVGDGVVDFAGQQSGYGNIVIVNHRNNQQTVYAHLSRMDVRSGQNVTQGQFIGAVGSTGWATGPHLHFEFRVNGAFVDPLTAIAQQTGGAVLSAASRPAFARLAIATRMELSAAFSVVQASAD